MIVKGLILRSVPLIKSTLLSSRRFCGITVWDEGSTDKSQLVYHYVTQIYETRKSVMVGVVNASCRCKCAYAKR